jgi:hypothetical protein
MTTDVPTQLVALIAFSGDLDPDPAAATDDLHRAGFQVEKFPEQLRHLLEVPGDDWLEASRPADLQPLRLIMAQVEAIAARHGGTCTEVREVGLNHKPFTLSDEV